jgi:hypothetical protein
MKNISIEYAHIYTNQDIAEEQRISLDILKKLKYKEGLNNTLLSLVIMIDDYSFPDPSFDYAEFSEWLHVEGFAPDLIIRESMLIPLCDQVVAKITDVNLKEELIEYVKSKRYPCSLFIAAWYLLRLGCLSAEFFPKELVGEQLINILPKSFKPFEEKAFAIIRAIEPWMNRLTLIENRYFDGREIQ